jgi:hypothetical protein
MGDLITLFYLRFKVCPYICSCARDTFCPNMEAWWVKVRSTSLPQYTVYCTPLHVSMSRYPSHLSPNITPTKSGKAQKSRARREPSGVFSLFQPQQIQQFKEAFSLIDQDRDGMIGERDLNDTFASLGAHDESGT